MKKFLFILSAAATCFFVSCKDKNSTGGGMSDMAKKNLAASHIVNDAFTSGDPSKIDSAVASDFVDHTDQGDKNRDSLKAMITSMKQMYPDLKMTIMKEFADDEYVFSQMNFTGTSNGQSGMPAGPYSFHAIQVVRFKDGKGVEHWEYTLFDEMMKMMPMQPVDTSKMSGATRER